MTELRRWMERSRDAQQSWAGQPLENRLRVLRAFRYLLVARMDPLVESITFPARQGASESLAGELIPLTESCRFLERVAPEVLVRHRMKRKHRPWWMVGARVELQPDPWGVVLIIGAANYPLFLPGVQVLQALAAGNAVLVKPARGATPPVALLGELLANAGLDGDLLRILPEAEDGVSEALQAGVDKLVLTGSMEAGRAILRHAAQTLTPATMELSGCDAMFVLPSADLKRVADCLEFGLRFNGGASCIAPRRVFVPHPLLPALERQLLQRICHVAGRQNPPRLRSETPGQGNAGSTQVVSNMESLVAAAIDEGARVVHQPGLHSSSPAWVLSDARPEMQLLQADLMAPVAALVPVPDLEEARRWDRVCPYALGASVFGRPREALPFARRIDAGCVVINDCLAATGDPRLPFGGRHQSGFGVTRGAQGLLEMTQWKAIVQQRSGWLPHLDPPSPFDADILRGYLGCAHADGWTARLAGAWRACSAALRQRAWQRESSMYMSQSATSERPKAAGVSHSVSADAKVAPAAGGVQCGTHRRGEDAGQ